MGVHVCAHAPAQPTHAVAFADTDALPSAGHRSHVGCGSACYAEQSVSGVTPAGYLLESQLSYTAPSGA